MSTYDWIRYLGFGEVSSLKHQRSKIVRKTLNVVSTFAKTASADDVECDIV